MPFDRRNLPDPISYYESEGLKLTSRGKWRTTACQFHGGSDSMRINTDSGAFACMAVRRARRLRPHGRERMACCKSSPGLVPLRR